MTKSLNIGLVGSGFMGQAHTDAYRRAGMLYRNLPCIPVLYAIADQNDSLAEEARRKLGFAKAYGDWRRLIEDPDVHVVDITTPNHLHVDVALAALEAGKHVYCEKPMAVKVQDAQRMAAAAKKAGANTLVAFNNVKTPVASGQADHRSGRNRRTGTLPREIRPRLFQRPVVAVVLALFQRACGDWSVRRSRGTYGFGGPVPDGRHYCGVGPSSDDIQGTSRARFRCRLRQQSDGRREETHRGK